MNPYFINKSLNGTLNTYLDKYQLDEMNTHPGIFNDSIILEAP